MACEQAFMRLAGQSLKSLFAIISMYKCASVPVSAAILDTVARFLLAVCILNFGLFTTYWLKILGMAGAGKRINFGVN